MQYIRKFIPTRLLTRCMLIIIVPTLIGQFLIIFMFYDRHWYNVSYYTSNLIVGEIMLLLESKQYDNHLIQDYLNLSYQYNDQALLNNTQPKLYEELEIFKNILTTKIQYQNIVTLTGNKTIKVSFQLPTGVIDITFSSKLLMNPTTYIFVMWLIFLTTFLLSVSLLLLRGQISSILKLVNAADGFGKGIMKKVYFKPSGAKEIRLAGIALIKMKERIERQIAKRAEMLAMISHDLRTPLARIKLQLELMDGYPEKDPLNQDITTMEQIIANYLDFVNGEGGEQFSKVYIVDWFNNFIQSKWSDHNISLHYTLQKDVMLNIKNCAFERALSNLLNNAIKYATNVQITLKQDNANIVICIDDNGPGINDVEKELVFQPFYRSDKSRSPGILGNTGLGLAIAKEIITGHYGNIQLKNSTLLGGLLVKITLMQSSI